MTVWTKQYIPELTGIPYLNDYIETRDEKAENHGLYLNLKFESGNKILKFEFPNTIRITDRHLSLNKILAEQNLDGNIWLLTTTQSELIDWFNKESLGILPNQTHFIIITQEKVIEIITDRVFNDSYPEVISSN